MRSLLLALLACAVAEGADLVGTDLLDGRFVAGLRAAAGPAVADFAGTLPARRAFTEGRAAAAILLMRPGEASPVAGAREFRLASAVVVVATHGSNRMDQISFEQLANAYARDARAPARNWNDLDPAARSELMTPALSSPPGTLVLEIFQGLVLEGQAFRPDVRLRVEPALAADLLASRAGSIVLLPKAPAARGRVLPVADGRPGRSATAYGPDENNVHNGDYPLQLPLILHVRPDKVAALRPALRWLCSDAAASLLADQGLTPAPAAARAAFLQRLDTR
ncbi:MAG: hypothetical protein FJ384_00345 [Verrucomicrobia bacterium]|nr:hypothetical protein [Verrucomicrobiota bacterium]